MIQKVRRIFRRTEAVCESNEWPKPRQVPVISKPTFLFILTPPNSGSTALAHVLNSAHQTMLLQERGEGQWLVPGMCAHDRWNPHKYIDWESVRAVWLSRIRFIEQHVGRVDTVIEKSPPNLVRADQLFDAFPRHATVVFNRNPYANCASVLHRYCEPEKKSEAQQTRILRGLASDWVLRSQYLKEHIEKHSPVFFTYEEFCASPEGKAEEIRSQLPGFAGVDVSIDVDVKDYKRQGLSNQNRRQIDSLSENAKSAIADELSAHEDLLRFFGYRSDWEQ